MRALIDTSALVRRLLREEGWEELASLWRGADALLASRLLYPETRSALARARRAGRLDARGHEIARSDLEDDWERFDVVELGDLVARAAGEVVERFPLRAGDAVHLASALLVADPDLTFVTWDRRLARAAHETGLAVAPAL